VKGCKPHVTPKLEYHSLSFFHSCLFSIFADTLHLQPEDTTCCGDKGANLILNSGNACCHSVQNLLSSWLLSKIVKIKLYKIITLPVVLYGCETWSLTIREEHRLKVFESGVLKRVFGTRRDGVTGGWRKLHNEKLCNLYSLQSIISVIKSRWKRWAEHLARMKDKRNAYRLLVGKPERDQ
jgi:hypothetical protein